MPKGFRCCCNIGGSLGSGPPIAGLCLGTIRPTRPERSACRVGLSSPSSRAGGLRASPHGAAPPFAQLWAAALRGAARRAPPASPSPRRRGSRGVGRCGLRSCLRWEQGRWNVSRPQWVWIFTRPHHFGGKKRPLSPRRSGQSDYLLVCLPSHRLPSSAPFPRPVGDHAPPGGGGRRLLVLKSRPQPAYLALGRKGGAGCFRMLIRRSGLVYCLAFSPPFFSSLISTPRPKKKKRTKRG